jgi:hypothetical protein
MRGQDWLDVEPFFDAISKPEPAQEPVALFIEAHDAKREKDAERYRFCKTLEGQVLFIQIIRNKGADALDAAVDDVLAYIEREGA